jgi:hypothetical protein
MALKRRNNFILNETKFCETKQKIILTCSFRISVLHIAENTMENNPHAG